MNIYYDLPKVKSTSKGARLQLEDDILSGASSPADAIIWYRNRGKTVAALTGLSKIDLRQHR